MSNDLDQTASSERVLQSRRNLIGAAVTAIMSALLIAVLWLISRGSPSAGRDTAWPPAP